MIFNHAFSDDFIACGVIAAASRVISKRIHELSSSILVTSAAASASSIPSSVGVKKISTAAPFTSRSSNISLNCKELLFISIELTDMLSKKTVLVASKGLLDFFTGSLTVGDIVGSELSYDERADQRARGVVSQYLMSIRPFVPMTDVSNPNHKPTRDPPIGLNPPKSFHAPSVFSSPPTSALAAATAATRGRVSSGAVGDPNSGPTGQRHRQRRCCC